MQDPAHILTITSLKGGTAKTTLTGLLALYLVQRCRRSVMLVDLDAQVGTTALFLYGKTPGLSVSDLLQASASGALEPALCREAFQPTPYVPSVFVLPGDSRLGQIARQGLPQHALRDVLDAAAFGGQSIFLIDTGTAHALVDLGIAAANAVLVPTTPCSLRRRSNPQRTPWRCSIARGNPWPGWRQWG